MVVGIIQSNDNCGTLMSTVKNIDQDSNIRYICIFDVWGVDPINPNSLF